MPARTPAPILLALAVLLAAPLAAQPGGRHGFGPGPAGPRALAEYLDLDAEQSATARALFADLVAEVRPLLDAQRPRRDELRALLATPSPSLEAVGRLVVQMHGTRERVRAAREKQEAAFAALLDDAQRLKWEALREWRQARRPGPGEPLD